MLRSLCLAVALVVLTGCAPRAVLPELPADAGSAAFPEADYLDAARRGEKVFAVAPGESLVVVEVRSGGRLGHLGHDHIVASHDLRGYVRPAAGRADLQLRLDQLVVDEAALRAEAGLTTQPPEAAVAGTRTNMLEKTLQAERYPYASIRVTGISGAGPEVLLDVAVTVRETTHRLVVAARLRSTDERVEVEGALELRQTDFGIVPMSILGGAIYVEDVLPIRFHIVAHRLANPG